MVDTKRNNHVKNINETMRKFHNVEGMTLEDAKEIIGSIEPDLIALLPEYQRRDDDSRLGNVSYGYKGSDKEFIYNLQYISDRWGAGYRIAWMLGLVNPKYR